MDFISNKNSFYIDYLTPYLFSNFILYFLSFTYMFKFKLNLFKIRNLNFYENPHCDKNLENPCFYNA